MENKYYVYVYLDPRKSGNFTYGDYSFDFEPFYIGKGSGYRFNHHLKQFIKYNKHKKNKINKIINEGLNPIIIKTHNNLTEEESFYYEKELIKLIGRSDMCEGPLTNKTDGGDGMSGFIITNEMRELRSKMFKGEKNPMYGKGYKQLGEKNPMYGVTGEKHFMYGKNRPIETILKISKNHSDVKGSLNPNSKITEWDVIIIRKFFTLKRDKIKKVKIYETISKRYGISESNSRAICLNKIWKNVSI
ncbi:MAG: LEM-3-like GIY-YIG domain-containing protein [bacterium]|jgi:hypothetical protein